MHQGGLLSRQSGLSSASYSRKDDGCALGLVVITFGLEWRFNSLHDDICVQY